MFKYFLFFFLTASSILNAQDIPIAGIEDDSALRISIHDTWLTEAPRTVLNYRPRNITLNGGSRLQLRSETGRDELLVILARELPGTGSSGNPFPGWAQGSWIYSRKMDDGSPVRIRIFLKSDPNTYIQFRPFSHDKSLLDVVVYDAYVLRSLPLPLAFDRLMVLPMKDILSTAGDRFPHRYFDPDPMMYRDSRSFISAVRPRLNGLYYTDDGAINERGSYVFINTLGYQNPEIPDAPGGLNCSGFAKWVIDGILRPFSGERLPIAPLKEPFGDRGSSFTEPWETLRDPFFGLDWCRNLAYFAWSRLRSPAFAVLEEFEVRNEPFSEIITRQSGAAVVQSYTGFLSEAGYGVEGLHALLYTLAIDEPGRIYLAAVNNEIGAPVTRNNPRGLPRLRQYYHVAVLVPYFTEQGNFQVTVFESAAETSFTSFKNRYPGQFVNLVRIPLDSQFDP